MSTSSSPSSSDSPKLSAESTQGAILTPTSTPSPTPQRSSSSSYLPSNMEVATESTETSATKVEAQNPPPTAAKPDTQTAEASNTADKTTATATADKKAVCKKHKHKKKAKRAKKQDSTTETSTTEDQSDSSSDESDSASSEDEKAKRRAKKQKAAKKKTKKKHHKKTKRAKESSESDSDESDSEESESESSADERRRRKQKRRKNRRRQQESEDNVSVEEEEQTDEDENARLRAQIAALNLRNSLGSHGGRSRRSGGRNSIMFDGLDGIPVVDAQRGKNKKKKKGAKRASTLEFKRVDQLWDSNIHDYKLTESAEVQEDEFDQYIFTVRRKFDWENKYKNTVVDIKSKFLRDALQEIMKDVKGVSLVEDQPSVDPNMLFLYLEEIKAYAKKTLKAKAKAEKKSKIKKRIQETIAHCKLLVAYLDEDYEETKKTLYPMLEAGNITFDLLWALFKPNTITYTTTYGASEHPRCFKVDYATKEINFMRGEWYSIEGRYLEYDGKSFGLGDFEVDVDSFKGPRRITSLSTYPLKYHKDAEGLKAQLIERGKRFVQMEGMNYRFHKGLAFQKKKKVVAKVNINGRIMIDPAIFRRINPNYPIAYIKPKESEDFLFPNDSDDDSCSCCESDSEAVAGAEGPLLPGEGSGGRETKFKVIYDDKDKPHLVEVPVDEDGKEIQVEKIEQLGGEDGSEAEKKREFTEEELLIASPVVLGFAFSEKLWLEFTISGVTEIEWNTGAFDSLVLPANQKSIVKALVESHKFHAAKTIDDVVQGKGKGLVAVLHGPPGTGKTLTAEGIAELLKCPLYMVSAGELGTDPRLLEAELQKILDIAHSWGAVLLLDEADVFLEKREIHDIHRNALVSIFLRLLEYFQGILFLTTNRVETFDDAFQSRIHVALRYGELTTKAKKAVWKIFLERVRAMEGIETATFKEHDYDILARNNMNGRQIKNAVRTAQALAVNEKSKLTMEHIRRVLAVAESFEQDLKGGSGYQDAMRSYT